MPFQLSKIKHDDSDTFLFIYLSKSHYGNKNSETTKARNLKFGQMIGVYTRTFVTAILEALRLVVWGICTLNLWQRSLLSDFTHARARAAMDEWLKSPVLET